MRERKKSMSRRKKRSGHFWQKALSSLVCMTMMYPLSGVGGEVLATTSSTINTDSPSADPSTYVMNETSAGMLDTKINPHILIQHYYQYPYQELGNVVKDFGGKDKYENLEYWNQEEGGKPTANNLKNFLSNHKVVWNTNSRAVNSTSTPSNPT